jgi:hypothetical protein
MRVMSSAGPRFHECNRVYTAVVPVIQRVRINSLAVAIAGDLVGMTVLPMATASLRGAIERSARSIASARVRRWQALP